MRKVFLVSAAVILAMACNDVRAGDDAPKEGKNYEIQVVTSPGEVTKGAKTEYAITITPKGDYVLKKVTPFKAKLSPTGSVKLDKAELTAKDFKDPEAEAKTVATSFVCEAGGKQQISADLSFFLCTAELCQRFTDKAELNFDAK